MAKRSANIWIPWRLIESKAFLALKTATAHKILAIFWTKRQMVEIGRKGKEQWDIANNGEIVAVLIDDCVTLKKIYKEKNRLRLQPANKKMKPIYAKNVEVQGKLVSVFRNYEVNL